jgi:cytochrome P450
MTAAAIATTPDITGTDASATEAGPAARTGAGPAAGRFAERPAPASPAGPVEPGTPIRMPPMPPGGKLAQTLGFVRNPLESALNASQRYGDVWQLKLASRADSFTVTCHPDHVKSLLAAKPDDAPSLTGESPLRPILGPNSVLTLVGPRHMRQRKLLLPPFHGEAVQRYVEMIEQVVDRELSSWRQGQTFGLAERMQAVTLEVIMRGVFGIDDDATAGVGSAGARVKGMISRLLRGSATPLWQLVELQNIQRLEPRGVMKVILDAADRRMYELIRERRALGTIEGRHDVFSLLLEARDEDGQPLTDEELRDELLTLLLAGHETTANSLAWTHERLLRTPAAYDALREAVRGGDEQASNAHVEATIHEGMRVRPVIPFIVRMAKRPWQLGQYVVPANTPVAMSIVAVHHRPDVYPEPEQFRPERFIEDGRAKKPGTYTWIPFGGGIRRCLGATLAMAEQRVVMRAIAERVDLAAPDAAPEKPRQRNVTMIPGHGGRVTVERILA